MVCTFQQMSLSMFIGEWGCRIFSLLSGPSFVQCTFCWLQYEILASFPGLARLLLAVRNLRISILRRFRTASDEYSRPGNNANEILCKLHTAR